MKTLEDWKDAYYEQQAGFTEARGMLAQERDAALTKVAELDVLLKQRFESFKAMEAERDRAFSYADQQHEALRAIRDFGSGVRSERVAPLQHAVRWMVAKASEALAKNPASGSLTETPLPSTAQPLPGALKAQEQLDAGRSADEPASQPGAGPTTCLPTGLNIPEGWKLVPVTPDPTMVEVGVAARWRSAVRDSNNVREIYAAMLAAAPEPPQLHAIDSATERWRHKARGTVYTVIGEATLQTKVSLVDELPLVVYRGDDGRLWARPPGEFHDGRFEKVSSPATGDEEVMHGMTEILQRLAPPDSETPKTDREEYVTGPNDVGFRVVNPALCREFERASAAWRFQQEALWEPCDCGCPGKARPRSKEAVAAIRALHAAGAVLSHAQNSSESKA